MATAERSRSRISGNGNTSNGEALGLIETKGLVGMIEASGAEAAGKVGELVSAHVIPRPDDAVLRTFLGS
jgi:ethanolamine utilization protein EutM